MSPRVHSGVLFEIDKPSRKPPRGARHHRVAVGRDAAEKVCETSGAALRFVHAPLSRLGDSPRDGWIERCWIEDNVVRFLACAFGPLPGNFVSYEMSDVRVQDIRGKVWQVIGMGEFNGVAVIAEGQAYAEAYIN